MRCRLLLSLALPLGVLCLAVTPNAACSYTWPDAVAQGPLPDAGAPDAPLRDATTEDHAPIGSFNCDGALVCDTFDDGALGARWSAAPVSPGGDLRIETLSDAPTTPSALFATRPPATAPPSTAYLTRVFTQTFRRASLELKIKPEQLDATQRACVGGIVFGDGTSSERLVRLLVGNGRAGIQERTPTLVPHELSAAPPLGRWSKVTLAIEVPGRLVVHLDDAVVLDEPLDPAWAASTATRVFVGINFMELPSAAVSIHFDDVRFDGS